MIERKKVPDIEKAKSVIVSAKDEIGFTLTLQVSEESSNTIIRNIYESFRMLGEALLIKKGIDFSDHIDSINELLKLEINSPRPIYLIENLRKIRHRINYQGYKAVPEEAKEAISIATSCFNLLFEEVNKIIKN